MPAAAQVTFTVALVIPFAAVDASSLGPRSVTSLVVPAGAPEAQLSVDATTFTLSWPGPSLSNAEPIKLNVIIFPGIIGLVTALHVEGAAILTMTGFDGEPTSLYADEEAGL